jgi:acetyl esterase/lipase
VNMQDVAKTDQESLLRSGFPPERTLSYGAEADQIADFRRGTHGRQRPLLVLIHGGYWKPEYDRLHVDETSGALAQAGWSVLTLEYRRLPGNPDATLGDICTALTVLPQQLDHYNGRLLLLGHSAGGHLALWAASQCQDALQGVLALAPAANLALVDQLGLGEHAVQRFLGGPAAVRPDVDPVHLSAPTVPVTIIQGSADDVVLPEVAVSYCAVFTQTHLRILPGMGHFDLIDPKAEAWPAVLAELDALS